MRGRLDGDLDSQILLEDLHSSGESAALGLANCDEASRVKVAFGLGRPLEAFLARGVHNELMTVVDDV